MNTMNGFINIVIDPSDTYDPLAVSEVLKSLFSYHMKHVHTMEEKRNARKLMNDQVAKYTKAICKSKKDGDPPIVMPQVTIQRGMELQDLFLNQATIFVQLGWVSSAEKFIPLTQEDLESLKTQLKNKEKDEQIS